MPLAPLASNTAAIEAAEVLLAEGGYTIDEVDAAYAALNAAIAALRSLVNVAYKMNVTANCNPDNAYKVTDGTISTSNYWAGQNGSANVPANESELVIDLDGTYDLEAVRVYPYWGGQRIYQYEEVESLYLMSGDYDLAVTITGRSLRAVAEFVHARLAVIDGVTGTATHFILKKYKEKNHLFAKLPEQEERMLFV